VGRVSVLDMASVALAQAGDVVNPGLLIGLAGAVATVATALFAYVGNRNAKRVDATVAVLSEVRAWSDQLRDSEEACRTELAAVRRELDREREERRNEVGALTAAVVDLRSRLTQAGLN
jgi:hypothetical protein